MIAGHRVPCSLAVLKRFGPGDRAPLLPDGGLDARPRLPGRSAELSDLLDRLDAGGRGGRPGISGQGLPAVPRGCSLPCTQGARVGRRAIAGWTPKGPSVRPFSAAGDRPCGTAGGDGECLTRSGGRRRWWCGWDLGHALDRRGPDRRGLSDGGAGGGDRGASTERLLRAVAVGARSAPTVVFDATPATGGGGGGRSVRGGSPEGRSTSCGGGRQAGDQVSDVTRPEQVAESVTVNFTWPAAATEVAVRLRAQGQGRVVVSRRSPVWVRPANSSTARPSGASTPSPSRSPRTSPTLGVTVQVVRPGFVRSKMTAGLKPGRSPSPRRT